MYKTLYRFRQRHKGRGLGKRPPSAGVWSAVCHWKYYVRMIVEASDEAECPKCRIQNKWLPPPIKYLTIKVLITFISFYLIFLPAKVRKKEDRT